MFGAYADDLTLLALPKRPSKLRLTFINDMSLIMMLYLMVQKDSLLYLDEGSAGLRTAMFWLMVNS